MKYIKENWKPLITSVILFILPIAAYYINAVNNIYSMISLSTILLFVFVSYQSSQNKKMIKSALNRELLIAFLWNVFLCVCFGWWWKMLIWIYVSASYYGVQEKQKNKNVVKGE
jgi:hypothetical protein